MADEDTDENGEDAAEGNDEEKSFRERVEEIREKRAQEDDDERRERMEEMMGGGGGGGPGGMGGNPFAQMMGGMMGGGPGGAAPGAGGPGGSEASNEELVREVRQLRDEVRDATRQLQRIADALEDD